MVTCSKIYRDIPLSHRQPNHSGRCSRLHGHSWSITLTFGATELDSNGFVVDFGELHYIADWIDENLDHGTIVCDSDPRIDEIRALDQSGLLKIIAIEQASCEGIARYLFSVFEAMVGKNTNGRAWIQKIHVEEDSRNSATFEPEKKSE
jgi:6-pyruvoyltetrahydropterin/6-carboxytetrahydropterin synthase